MESLSERIELGQEFEGLPVYAVGGVVRSLFTGNPITDVDLMVTGVTPDEMEERGFKLIWNKQSRFPVFIDSMGREVGLARTEESTLQTHKGGAGTRPTLPSPPLQTHKGGAGTTQSAREAIAEWLLQTHKGGAGTAFSARTTTSNPQGWSWNQPSLSVCCSPAQTSNPQGWSWNDARANATGAHDVLQTHKGGAGT